MKKNKKKIFSLIACACICITFLLSNGSFVNAQNSGSAEGAIGDMWNSSLGQPTQQSSGAGSGQLYKNIEMIPGANTRTDDFCTYMKQVVSFGFATIGILAMFMLCIGAYQYLMAAGNLSKVDSAKTTVASAALGLILGLASYIILQTIHPALVQCKLSGGAGGLGGAMRGTVTPGTSGIPGGSNTTGTVPPELKDRIALYDQYVKEAAAKYGVPENVIRAVIDKESSWDPNAIGRADPRDKGIMQINERWHPDYFANNDWQNPAGNIDYGASLLAKGYQATGSWEGAAGYFHRGPTNWNDSRGQAYSADFATRRQQYENSGYI